MVEYHHVGLVQRAGVSEQEGPTVENAAVDDAAAAQRTVAHQDRLAAYDVVDDLPEVEHLDGIGVGATLGDVAEDQVVVPEPREPGSVAVHRVVYRPDPVAEAADQARRGVAQAGEPPVERVEHHLVQRHAPPGHVHVGHLSQIDGGRLNGRRPSHPNLYGCGRRRRSGRVRRASAHGQDERGARHEKWTGRSHRFGRFRIACLLDLYIRCTAARRRFPRPCNRVTSNRGPNAPGRCLWDLGRRQPQATSRDRMWCRVSSGLAEPLGCRFHRG